MNLQTLPLSEILSLAERCLAAEEQLAQIRAAVSGTDRAPRKPAPGRRASPRRGAAPVSRQKLPPSCSVCRTADGTVRWKRCASCRKAGKGKPQGAVRGTGRKAQAAAIKAATKHAKPNRRKLVKAGAPASPGKEDGPRCDGSWMARVRMKFKENPAIEFLPGVQTILKRCAANDWPLLSEIPAVIK